MVLNNIFRPGMVLRSNGPSRTSRPDRPRSIQVVLRRRVRWRPLMYSLYKFYLNNSIPYLLCSILRICQH